MAKIPEFVNLELMQTVRNNSLNPLIRKVENEITPELERVSREAHDAVKNVTLDVPTKTLTFDKGDGGFKPIDLTPIMPTFDGIGVENHAGSGPADGIKLIKLTDASVSREGASTAVVSYDWKKLVSDNQVDLIAKMGVLPTDLKPIKAIEFKGSGGQYSESGGMLTVNIPEAAGKLVGKVGTGSDQDIEKIEITGTLGASNITGGVLTIELPKEGSGGGITNQNFKGFFSSLGDLTSQVTDAIDGKSYAFAKDSTLGGEYYTPYFYVNGAWATLKQDPALTYSGPLDPKNHGVFSIKPDDAITVDSKGQLDLSGLRTADTVNFHGFFDSVADLTAAVKTPLADRSFGYTKNPNGSWVGRAWKKNTSTGVDEWAVIAPAGSLSMFKDSATPTNPAAIYGIANNEMWNMNANGIAELKPIETAIRIIVPSDTSTPIDAKVKAIQFMAGKSYVSVQNKKLFINHPQRVIQYTSTFEQEHNSQDYEGNIFYDQTSRAWMGWATPGAQGAVGAKWTRIAHEGMSHEVKGLSLRNPARAPDATTGILGDNGKWYYNSETYVAAGDSTLPDELGDSTGAYITTMVQDLEADVGKDIPTQRMQICHADVDGGETYVRRFKPAPSPGSEQNWGAWVRTSFSKKDINAHENDHGAHKKTIKFHKVTSFSMKYANLANQTLETYKSVVRGQNCSLIADNYGVTEIYSDYFDYPYSGNFRIKGELAFSGYESNKPTPTGDWKVTMLKVKKDQQPSQMSIFKTFKYNHQNTGEKYPPISFELENIALEEGDKIRLQIEFSNPLLGKTLHPDLYFIPVKSYFVMEDMNTMAGTQIGWTNRNHMANVDVNGNVGVKVHHTTLTDPTSNVRVYGEKVVKEPKEMKPS